MGVGSTTSVVGVKCRISVYFAFLNFGVGAPGGQETLRRLFFQPLSYALGMLEGIPTFIVRNTLYNLLCSFA